MQVVRRLRSAAFGFLGLLLALPAAAQAPTNWQLGFQTASSPTQHAIESLLEFTRTKNIREPSGAGTIPEWVALDDLLGGGP